MLIHATSCPAAYVQSDWTGVQLRSRGVMALLSVVGTCRLHRKFKRVDEGLVRVDMVTRVFDRSQRSFQDSAIAEHETPCWSKNDTTRALTQYIYGSIRRYPIRKRGFSWDIWFLLRRRQYYISIFPLTTSQYSMWWLQLPPHHGIGKKISITGTPTSTHTRLMERYKFTVSTKVWLTHF